ncbi:eisosome protein SEG2-like [Tripterygium wilfordii]|uniref:Eisosome protein SEG2-like n=1 Tax=Tripterygium wilfordii TaxID=458696 RepID=A0A7J7BYR1_TRIWF|nr:eisosome protein SEG2-like [Tripterygium wilfordii]KAF5727001.1 eisosome protein SEG2-like [Tripterygium wilfordii]
MGCFLACFGSSKDRKRRRQRHKVQPRDQRNASCTPPQSAASLVHDHLENTITPVLEVGDKPVEQLSSSTRKRVTFDSNITTYEHDEVSDFSPKNNDSDNREEQENSAKSSQSQSSDVSSITSSSGSYPPNHRYENCRDSDDELDDDSDIDYHDDDSDDDVDGVLEEYDDMYEDDYDSRISRTRIPVTKVATDEIDSSTVIENLPEGDVKPFGLNRNTRDRSNYVHSVLNPVENLTQWKAVKARGTPPALRQQKENSSLDHESLKSFSSEPCFKEMSFSFKAKSDQPKKSNQEMAVDASLSTWLGSAESTPSIKTTSTNTIALDSITPKPSMSGGSNSPISFEDRPILGALTVEELKQLSASSSSSPRKSPSRSPDEMPIIGTVGTYWNDTNLAKDSRSATSYRGIPNTTSKYRGVYSK